jgi:hypothetical protein
MEMTITSVYTHQQDEEAMHKCYLYESTYKGVDHIGYRTIQQQQIEVGILDSGQSTVIWGCNYCLI